MPNICMKCNSVYSDGAKELIDSCPCGGKLFIYLKEDELKKRARSKDGKIMSVVQQDDGVQSFDIETIKETEDGKYEIDLNGMMKSMKDKKDKPLIYKLKDGKYVVDMNKDGKVL